jgi:hypothetical protein
MVVYHQYTQTGSHILQSLFLITFRSPVSPKYTFCSSVLLSFQWSSRSSLSIRSTIQHSFCHRTAVRPSYTSWPIGFASFGRNLSRVHTCVFCDHATNMHACVYFVVGLVSAVRCAANHPAYVRIYVTSRGSLAHAQKRCLVYCL